MSKTVEANTGAGWLTYKTASEYCGLGRTVLTELVTTGEVEAAKIGARVLIKRESLDEFLDSHSYTKTR